MLFVAEALSESSGETFGSGDANAPEGDFDGGENGSLGTAVDPIEAGDRDVFWNFEAFFSEAADKVIGLVVGCADPGCDTFASTFGGLGETGFEIEAGTGEHSNDVPGGDAELKSGHFLKEGTVAAVGPGGSDGVVTSVESDFSVTFFDKVIHDGGDASVVIDVDAIEGVVFVLLDQRNHWETQGQFVDERSGERINEEDAPVGAFSQALDLANRGMGHGGGFWGDEVDFEGDFVRLGEFGDSRHDLFTGAGVFAGKVFLTLTADEDGEAGLGWAFGSRASAGFHVGVAKFGGKLEYLGSRHWANSGMIGETAGDS